MTADPARVWADARARLSGLPNGRGVDTGFEAVDRHVREGHGDRVALRCVDLDESVDEYTYTDLHVLTNRFASMLDTLGVGPGQPVFTLLGQLYRRRVAGGVRPVVRVTPSGDHRATDGSTGARFLTTVDELLQRPEEL